MYFTYISFCLLGFGISMIFVPIIPLMNSVLKIVEKNNIENNSDASSAIYTVFTSIAYLSGPICGGILCDKFGYGRSCSFLSCFLMLLFLVQFCFFFKHRKLLSECNKNYQSEILDEEKHE